MFITPNFEVEDGADSYLLSPILLDGKVESYIKAEKVAFGSRPILLEEDVNRDRMLLTKLNDLNSMWLYPSGEIKIER